MNIAIVGLGLIGGSFAKSISKYTEHKVFAISHNSQSINQAIKNEAILNAIDVDDLALMDMTIICLPPKATKQFLVDNVGKFKQGSIVSDICGVKKEIVDDIANIYTKYRVNYISVHPMAGRECSGYSNSLSDLFFGRSLIMIDNENVESSKAEQVEQFMRSLGFAKIMHTTPENHDRIIAYTSQMCHITSNAFVKSPTSRLHSGYSGGSFEDLTRVAFLDPKIWIELFSMNRDALLSELNIYIDELKKYQMALETKDYDLLYKLLKEGSDIKRDIS